MQVNCATPGFYIGPFGLYIGPFGLYFGPFGRTSCCCCTRLGDSPRWKPNCCSRGCTPLGPKIALLARDAPPVKRMNPGQKPFREKHALALPSYMPHTSIRSASSSVNKA